MNAVEKYYLDGGTIYNAADRHNGAVTLLHLLVDGLKEKQAREARTLSGELSEDDFAPRDL